MNWSALDWGILGPALIAGLLVLATHVPLGMQVLDRGIVFIDLAIAQIAGLGVIAADALGLPEGGVAVQAAAVGAALLGAWLLTWTERRAPQQQEALIGVMFVLAACAGILLLAEQSARRRAPEGPAGRPDPVGQHDAAAVARRRSRRCCSRRCALGWVERLGRFGFYGAFALAVTASVQLVGVYLVFSSLIIPALGDARLTRRAPPRRRLRRRRRRLRARPGAVGAVRPALGRGDRLDAGGLRRGRGNARRAKGCRRPIAGARSASRAAAVSARTGARLRPCARPWRSARPCAAAAPSASRR